MILYGGMAHCSTPGGVIVSITGPSRICRAAIMTAQRRRRHRLDHIDYQDSSRFFGVCSTPGGVIVSITSDVWPGRIGI